MPRQLSDRLAALAADVDRAARPVPAAVIRERGKIRRQYQIALAAIAAGVTTLTAGAILIASTSPPPVPAGQARELPTQIPAYLLMPHEGEAGWIRDDKPNTPSVFNPCGGPDETLVGRIGAITITGPGRPVEGVQEPILLTEHLFLFRTEESAQAALQALGTQILDCGWSGHLDVYSSYGRHTLEGWAPTEEVQLGGSRHVLATLRGNVMIMIYATTSTEDYKGFDFIDDQVCTTMLLCQERLCYPDLLPSPVAGQPLVDPVPCPPGGPYASAMPGGSGPAVRITLVESPDPLTTNHGSPEPSSYAASPSTSPGGTPGS